MKARPGRGLGSVERDNRPEQEQNGPVQLSGGEPDPTDAHAPGDVQQIQCPPAASD